VSSKPTAYSSGPGDSEAAWQSVPSLPSQAASYWQQPARTVRLFVTVSSLWP
jgi:hypothetical protein